MCYRHDKRFLAYYPVCCRVLHQQGWNCIAVEWFNVIYRLTLDRFQSVVLIRGLEVLMLELINASACKFTIKPVSDIANGNSCRSLIFAVCYAFFWSGHCSASDLAQQRIDFVRAEAALNGTDTATYLGIDSALESYPLFPYLRYLELKRNLSDGPRIETYLQRYPSIRYAKLLRSHYLAHLAKTQQWRRFVKNYVESTNTKQRCLYNWALFQTGQRKIALQGAAKLWLVGKSQPNECNPLFYVLKSDPNFDAELVWRRFQLALQSRHLGLAKYLARQLSGSDKNFAAEAIRLHQKPGQVKLCPVWRSNTAKGAWAVMHGVDRLARTEPWVAQQLWEKRGSALAANRDDTARLEKRLAMGLVYRHHPYAFKAMQRIGSKADSTIRVWRVRAALVNQNWSQVKQALDELDPTEQSETKWQYWRARLLEVKGKQDEARSFYNNIAGERDFYGFLAADRLNTDYKFSNHAITPKPDEMAKMETRLGFQMVKEFLYFDRLADARLQWWSVFNQLDKSEKRTAAKIAQKWGLVQTAIFSVAKAKAWDDLDLRFPVLYRDPINKYAQLQKISTPMVFGLIRQESVFDEQIVSSAGARGLMQIMPATGRQIAKQFNERWRSSKQLFEPDRNIKYGVSYLGGLLQRFNQNFALAAAGYNAGPHRVDSWLKNRGAVDTDIWVETIPFKETRKYVRRVLAYSLIYQHQLGDQIRRISTYIPRINRTSTRLIAGSLSINQCH